MPEISDSLGDRIDKALDTLEYPRRHRRDELLWVKKVLDRLANLDLRYFPQEGGLRDAWWGRPPSPSGRPPSGRREVVYPDEIAVYTPGGV